MGASGLSDIYIYLRAAGPREEGRYMSGRP